MKKMVLNIMATTGITLVVLAVVALCHSATVIFISAVFQALMLNIFIYLGIEVLNRFEYRYSMVETGLKLIYVSVLVLLFGKIFSWYSNLSVGALLLMTIVVFAFCVALDTISIIGEVKIINDLIEQDKKS